MYGLYRQLKALVWGEEGEVEKKKPPAPPTPPQEPQKRFFSGVITSLSDTSGMIDHQVFFTLSVVLGGRTPQVGAMAHVTAERPHPLACWKATRVEVTEMWDSDTNEERRISIGFISRMSRTLAVVDCATTEVTFDPQLCAGTGYRYGTGDWVSVGVRVGEGGEEEEVEFVHPLREKEVEGTVTGLSHGYGFINGDIIFSFGLCGRSQVRVGEGVKVRCVECRHHTASWRAVSMTTLSTTCPHTFPSSQHSPSLPLLISSSPSSPSSSSSEGLLENRCGLELSEVGEVSDVLVGTLKNVTITIRNTRSHDHCLLSVKPLPQDPQISISLPPTSLWCSCNHLDREEEGDSSSVSEAREVGEVGEDGKEGEGVQGSSYPQSEVTIPQVGVASTSPHIHISRGQTLDVSVDVTAKSLGQISCLLLFSFLGGVRIGRQLRLKVTSSDLDSLKPSSTYMRGRVGGVGGRGQQRNSLLRGVVPGEKPHRPRLVRLPHRLKTYAVPEDLADGVWEGDERDILDLRPQLTQPLCMKNYFSRFSSLLHMEEIQRDIDMRNFDIFSVPLRSRGQYLSLEVVGLGEGRPSLLRGDRVIASVERGTEREEGERGGERCWEGYIHEIGKDYVLLKFSQELHQNSFLHNYDIIFQFSRTSFRRMHHVVEIAHLLGSKVLFPGQQTPKQPLIKLPSTSVCNHDNEAPPTTVSIPFQFFNPVLNPRQRSAVARILAAQNRPAPYIVFGPPGTGKTVTLVEAILQIHQRSQASRVLACAPSNSAADLIMERLLSSGVLGEGEVVRLNAIQRAEPPSSIAPFCMDTDSADIAIRCRVVVSTCMTAGFLHSLSLPVGHFSHVVVDEAGQATEPGALLPASLLSNTHGQLVLAGDPHQLGPVLASHLSGNLGLSLSLLERLMTREPYLRSPSKYSDHGSYDPLMVTKLVENYRSHSSILSLYSDTFYHGELEARADPGVTSLMCNWEGLPSKGFPLLFHGVMGEDMREGNSPSWFNPVEIIQVVTYVQSLIDNSTFAPKLSDIGIISPYRKQVERIRWFLGRVGVEGIKVGSVEEFQGQERLVIIISTVRSTLDLLTSDLRHHLGFLGNQKRFNVAISRAQALLVVVGNPHLLCQDPYWRVLVQYAVDNGSYTGCPLPDSMASGLPNTSSSDSYTGCPLPDPMTSGLPNTSSSDSDPDPLTDSATPPPPPSSSSPHPNCSSTDSHL